MSDGGAPRSGSVSVRSPHRGRRLLGAAASGVALAVAVAAVALGVRSQVDGLLRVDDAVVQAATGPARDHPALLRALVVWEALLQPRWVYLAATLVCLWAWRRHGLASRALWAFVTMMACWTVAFFVKLLVQRARPVVDDALTSASGYSFPSGHAANAAAAATALVVLLWPLLRARVRGAVVAAAAVVVAATAANRVLLGMHYPSDVVAGVALGVGMVLASYAGCLRWNATRRHPTPPAPGCGAPATSGPRG